MRAPALLPLLFLLTGCSGSTPDAGPTDAPPPDLDFSVEPPSGVRAAQLMREFATGYPWRHSDHPTELEAARAYLKSQIKNRGLQLVEHAYRPTGLNLLGVDPGTTRADEWIVFSCHYDTQPNTYYGARDDALGCAALLEMGQSFSTRDWNHTLVWAFFDEEEKGLIGAQAFVKDALANVTVNLTANINLDPAGLHHPCGNALGTYDVNVILSLSKVSGPAAVPGYAELLSAVRSGLNASKVPADKVYLGTKQTYSYVQVGTTHNSIPGADYEAFDRVDVPSLWLGAPPRNDAGPATLWGYPNHTPGDSADAVEAICGSRALLEQGLSIAMDSSLHALERIDAV